MIEANNSTFSPDLPCSTSGTTSISFSISSYGGSNTPSFVSIDAATGVLNVVAPNISADTEYDFYVDSTISMASNPVQNIIKLTIKKWTVSNWFRCSTTSSSVCVSWSSGYTLSSGVWNLDESQTAQSLNTANQVVTGIIVGSLIALSWLNVSSLSSLWSIISQSQIFFLLFITGVFIPKDVKTVITGMKINLNMTCYFSNPVILGLPNIALNFFNFGLSDSQLEWMSIDSDSTAVNIYSFILLIILFICIHIWILLLNYLFKQVFKPERWALTTKVQRWWFKKLIILMTFAIYIRAIMSFNQYLLISSVFEVYYFNTSTTNQTISLVIAFIILILWVLLILFIAILVYYQKEYENNSKYAQFFNGIINQKEYKIYILYLFIRRFLFVVILITLTPISSFTSICMLLLLQVIYMGILFIKRPYTEVKANIIEIINETYFITILALLLHYNSADKWTGTPTTVYIWILTSNNMISFIIIMSKLTWQCKI